MSIFLLFPGCAFVTVPLFSPTQPLHETVVSGSGKDKILLMDISGIISAEEGKGLLSFEGKTSIVARIKEELQKAETDDRIKALVLRINSPGGTITASDIIYHEIKAFKEKQRIPVVACMLELATSGGYYISLAGDSIIAHPTTITGSIGVIVLKFNAQELLNKIGLKEESIISGDKKDIWSPFRPNTEEERKILQHITDTMYDHFINIIAESRTALTRGQIISLADGRIFTADEAVESRLIDSIGYLDDAVGTAQEMAGISKARVIMYHRPAGYKSNIYSQVQTPPLSTVNLINIDLGGLTEKMGVHFMYLWYP